MNTYTIKTDAGMSTVVAASMDAAIRAAEGFDTVDDWFAYIEEIDGAPVAPVGSLTHSQSGM